MVLYRKEIGEKSAELQALQIAYRNCEESNRSLQNRIIVLEKAHQQLCTEVLQLRGELLSQEDVISICSSADVFSLNKRSNPTATTIDRLQQEIERLQNSLNTLENMLEDGKLYEDSADEIYRFREELEWERHLVQNYLNGFQRKEVLHNLLLSLIGKTKAENRLVEKLRNEARVK